MDDLSLTLAWIGHHPQRFFLVNMLSALAWAPVYLLPGIVFGASVVLAEEVATRLAVLLVILALVLWGGAWGTRRAVAWLQPRFAYAVPLLRTRIDQAALGKGAFSWRLISPLLDPAKPESRALWVLGGLLLGAAWLFFGIVEDILTGDALVRVDRSVYRLMQGLHTPIADSLMTALTELGDAAVTVPVIVIVLFWLLWERAWRPAGYWLAAVGFAAALNTVLKLSLRLPRPVDLYDGNSTFSFPSGHASNSAVMYGFLAVPLAREVSPRWRWVAFAAFVVFVSLISVSRLYLGAHWVSDVLGGLAFGVAWMAVLGIGYMQHPAPQIGARSLSLVVVAALAGFGAWHVADKHASDIERYAIREHVRAFSEQAWWESEWRTLPVWRIDLEGEYEQPFTLQWAGSLESVSGVLLENAWQPPLQASTANILLLLDPSRPAMRLPVLPRVHNGRYEALVLVRPVAGQSDERLVRRLWGADAVLNDSRPIWIGTVTLETIRRPMSWFNLPNTRDEFDQPREVLLESLSGLSTRLAQRQDESGVALARPNWNGQVVLAKEPGSFRSP